MWLALIPVLSQLFGESGPIGQYFASKNKQIQATNDLQLAKIEADKQAIISGNQAQTDQTRDKLNATTQQFKQTTFYLLVCPIIFSVLFPSKAAVLWANFELIPVWFRTLFGAVYCTIWGIPLATGYVGGIFSGIGTAIQDRRDYQLAKAKINRDAVFASLRSEPQFKGKGIDVTTVNMIDKALDAGEK